CEDVLLPQEVERAAGTAELLTAGHGTRLGAEAVKPRALFAEARGRVRLEVQVSAVQRAIDVRQLVVEITELEVAPQRVVVTVLELGKELARARRKLLDRTVVAVGRVVVVGVDAPEERIGRLVHEVAEQLAHGTLARVRARAQLPGLAELP